jgi:hypothetical protein
MNTLPLSILLTVGLLTLQGCSSTVPRGRLLPQDALIRTLQERRGKIRAASPSEDLRFPADLDPSPLVGIGIDSLQAALGTPDYCWTEGPLDPPCQERGRWMYAFHHLPENSLGGGPELALSIGSSRRVDSARWVFTQ